LSRQSSASDECCFTLHIILSHSIWPNLLPVAYLVYCVKASSSVTMDLDSFTGPTVQNKYGPRLSRHGTTAPWTFTASNLTTSPLCADCMAIFQGDRNIDQNYRYVCHCFPYHNVDTITAPDASVRNCSLCSMFRLELLRKAVEVCETKESPSFAQPGPIPHPETCQVNIHWQELRCDRMIRIVLRHKGHKVAIIKLVGPFGMSSWAIAGRLTNV
jgi:hypothetical protein